MPKGYLVELGDGSLDSGDAITGDAVSFSPQSKLGNGEWNWSGTASGTTYVNEVEPGKYMMATDGNVYFVPRFGAVDNISSASTLNPPSHTSKDGILTGSDEGDVIDGNFVDEDGEKVDNHKGTFGKKADEIRTGAGNDTIDAQGGSDTVYAGSGSDKVSGGSGRDVLYGDSDPSEGAAPPVQINDANHGDTSSGFTITGQNIEKGFLTDPSSSNISTYSGGGFGTSGGVDSSYSNVPSQIGFDLTSGLSEVVSVNFDETVSDASFSFANLYTQSYSEQGHWAIYKDGELVAESDFTEQGSGSGNGTIDLSGHGEFDEIRFTSLPTTDGQNGSDYHITNVAFTPMPHDASGGDDHLDGGKGHDLIYGEGGADTLIGGAGRDTLDGGEGDDVLNIGAGDSAAGGTGSDHFILDSTNAAHGSGKTITIDGGEDKDGLDNDTLDLSEFVDGWSDIEFTSDDRESGSVTLDNGVVLSFDNMETLIVCFAHNTQILTPYGQRAVQTLKRGDRVVTRDNGIQKIRWINSKTVKGSGSFAPIRFEKGALGNSETLLVSPQHRMVYGDPRTSVLFDNSEVMIPAKHLVNGQSIRQEEHAKIQYFHILFDRHEVIFAEGTPSESFHPADQNLSALTAPAREELFQIFPGLRSDINGYGPTARKVLRSFETRALCLS